MWITHDMLLRATKWAERLPPKCKGHLTKLGVDAPNGPNEPNVTD